MMVPDSLMNARNPPKHHLLVALENHAVDDDSQSLQPYASSPHTDNVSLLSIFLACCSKMKVRKKSENLKVC